jgi:hypothetical protein
VTERFRCRCKVLTDADGKITHMVALGRAVVITDKADVGFGRQRRVEIRCFAMAENETTERVMTMEEWDKLPWRWFEDAGEAPRRMTLWPSIPEDLKH